jgi:Domain of unknown function (DUF6285)
MAGAIDAADLVDAVQAFLREIESELGGRRGFHAKVAANALAVVARELRERPGEVEAAALATLGSDVADACSRIRSGEWSAATPGLLDTLEAGIIARLAVDNPKFSTLARLGDKLREKQA